jgi:hypothetical protein
LRFCCRVVTSKLEMEKLWEEDATSGNFIMKNLWGITGFSTKKFIN